MPKVSVIVPMYGVEKYIERCARRLFEQTLNDIEYLFIDDCTLDKSVDILKHVLEEYPKRKSQVILHRMEKNCGLAAVRKWGVLHATGEYIIHCDSDDWVDVHMYEEMYNKAIVEDADVVVCDYAETDSIDEKHIKACHSTDVDVFIENNLLMIDSWAVWNKMFKRSLYSNIIYPMGAMGEDLVISLQLLAKCKRLSYIPVVFYYYYKNPMSITQKITKETCLRNFEQFHGNASIIFNLFELTDISSRTKSGLFFLKYKVKNTLLPLVWNKQYFDEWFHLYSDIYIPFMLSKHINLFNKVVLLLILLRILPQKKHRISFT